MYEIRIKSKKGNIKKVIYLFIFLAFITLYFIMNIFNSISFEGHYVNYFYLAIKILVILILLTLELFFIYSLNLAILKLKDKEAYFILNKEGFYFKGIYKTGTLLRWNDISSYELTKFNGVDMLKIKLKNKTSLLSQYGIIMKFVYKINKLIIGEDGFMFNISFFDGKELEVINIIDFYINNKGNF